MSIEKMVERYHFSIDAWDIKTERINYSLAIDGFLRNIAKIMGDKVVHGPTVIYRKNKYSGLTGSIITDLAHIVIHTISSPKEFTLNICSYKNFNIEEIRDFIIDYFDLDLNNIKVVNFSNIEKEEIECEEPGCVRKAVKIWHDRKVCKDHYDYYLDKESKSKMYDFD